MHSGSGSPHAPAAQQYVLPAVTDRQQFPLLFYRLAVYSGAAAAFIPRNATGCSCSHSANGTVSLFILLSILYQSYISYI